MQGNLRDRRDLRKAVRRVATVDELRALRGVGFDLNLDEIRNEDYSWVDKLDNIKD